MESTRDVTVFEGDKSTKFTIENNMLSLETLKWHYPLSNGLIFFDAEKVRHGLLIKDGHIITVEGIDEYYVQNTSTQQSQCAPKVRAADASKEERIQFFRQILEGKSTKQPSPIIVKSDPVKPKITTTDLRKLERFAPKTKLIKIGWKHKNIFGKYRQQKCGLTREIELDFKKRYSAKNIIDIGIENFQNDEMAANILARSNVLLGFFNGPQMETFLLPDGKESDLWSYLRFKNVSGRINLYLYSCSNENIEDFLEHLEAETNNECSTKKSIQEVKNTEYNKLNKNSVEQKILKDVTNSFEVVNSNLQEIDFELTEKKNYKKCTITFGENSQQLTVPILKLNTISSLLPLKSGNSLLPQISNVVMDSVVQNDRDALIKTTPLLKPDFKAATEGICSKSVAETSTVEQDFENSPLSNSIKTIEKTFNSINILFTVLSTSKYSGEISISEQDRSSIFYNLISECDSLTNENDFDPISYGHYISQLLLNNLLILQTSYEDDSDTKLINRIHSFPNLEQQIPHTIAYDIDKLIGFYKNNLIIAVIPTCLNECSPMVKWYRNNELYYELHIGLWLQVPQSEEDTTWQCEVTCKKYLLLKSKTIVIKPKIQEDFVVSQVEKSEFNISKECIGAGSSGIVCKGTYCDIQVAIKTVTYYKKFKKMIDREISVLKKINHYNFIKMLAWCKDANKVHIIMEYFDSKNLKELILDEDLKIEYLLDLNRKNDICLQLCDGISYLHIRNNPIIHKDIKCENILISKNGRVRICDFGLSKFVTTVTILQSTCSLKTAGTKMYMAPEILINKRDATEFSDVWSIACTMLEMYKEDAAWDCDDEEGLIYKLNNKEKPKLEMVPQQFQTIIEQCFSYEPQNRPKITEVTLVFKQAYIATLKAILEN